MKFPFELIPGTLIKRYNRFLADIILEDGQHITAHVANPGAMLGIKDPGLKVWVSYNPSPTRKLQYSWHLVEAEGTLIGVSTYWPNLIVKHALESKLIPQLTAYDLIQSEVKYGKNSRIDFLLASSSDSSLPACYVEVKNVHLKRKEGAYFPDSVTMRGTKHLHELQAMVEQGHRAIMLYIIQRSDCNYLSFAADIDPIYAITAREVFSKGVEALAFCCAPSISGLPISKNIPVR